MPASSEARARQPLLTAPSVAECRPVALRAFKSAFKKIWLARAPKPVAAILGHLWGSPFNGG